MNEIELIDLLWSIDREVFKRLKPRVRESGLSMTEAFVLWRTRSAGTTRVTALAEDLGLVPSTLTGVLDRLVEGGWLVRESDPEDRRAVVMKTTAKVSELLKSVTRAISDTFSKSFHRLPADTRERLRGDLRKLLECLQEERAAK